MTDEQQPDGPQPDPGALEALRHAVVGLPQVTGILLALAAVGSILGYLRARAYFNMFGASWLLDDLNTSQLIRFGTAAVPAAVTSVALLLGLANGQITRSQLNRCVRVAINVGALIGVASLLFWFIAGDAPRLRFYTSVAFFLVYSVCAAVAVTILLIETGSTSRRWREPMWWAIVPALFFAVFVANLLGRAEGQRDVTPETTWLPSVQVMQRSERQDHLLLARGEWLYVVDLAPANKRLSVRIVNAAETYAVSGAR